MFVPMNLKPTEIAEIQKRYYYLTNYEDDDPGAPINPTTYVDSNGDSLLHIASAAGDLRTVELLVSAGVDIDLLGDMDNTALHYAKSKGHEDVAKFLIGHGANTTLENRFGELASTNSKR
jgi:ankyrin repeat protein